MEKIRNFIYQSLLPPAVMILHENSFMYVKNMINDNLTPALCHLISTTIVILHKMWIPLSTLLYVDSVILTPITPYVKISKAKYTAVIHKKRKLTVLKQKWWHSVITTLFISITRKVMTTKSSRSQLLNI